MVRADEGRAPVGEQTVTDQPIDAVIQADRDRAYALREAQARRIMHAIRNEAAAKVLGDHEGDSALDIQAFAAHRLAHTATHVEDAEAPDDIERDIRIAIWNAAMNGGMGQDLSLAFIRRAMDEVTMKRALASLSPQSAPVTQGADGYNVDGQVYEAAVKGRQDFREAYRRVLARLATAYEPTEDELQAIREIGADQDLTDWAVMRQALRLYQLDHLRRKAGESVHWSGDAERAADFAGPLATQGYDRRTVEACADLKPLRSAGNPPDGRWGGQYQLGWDHAVCAYEDAIRTLPTSLAESKP